MGSFLSKIFYPLDDISHFVLASNCIWWSMRRIILKQVLNHLYQFQEDYRLPQGS
jgi:hypothetical protein